MYARLFVACLMLSACKQQGARKSVESIADAGVADERESEEVPTDDASVPSDTSAYEEPEDPAADTEPEEPATDSDPESEEPLSDPAPEIEEPASDPETETEEPATDAAPSDETESDDEPEPGDPPPPPANVPPQWPDGAALSPSNIGLTGCSLMWSVATDDNAVAAYRVYKNNALLATTDGAQAYAVSGLTPGTAYTFSIAAGDGAGEWTSGPSAQVETLPDTQAPTWSGAAALDVGMVGGGTAALTWPAAADNVAVVAYRVFRNNMLDGNETNALVAEVTGLNTGESYQFRVEARDAAGLWSNPGLQATYLATPPPPELVATPIDGTTVTTVAESTRFLYDGPDAVQVGMDPETIEPQRAAIVRGKVKQRDGAALSGVLVSVLNQTEYGETMTRDDGGYDLAVNGGGRMVLDFRRDGFAVAQRELEADWQSYETLGEIVMLEYDPQFTDINDTQELQVASGTVEQDDSGARQVQLFFDANTTAVMRFPDGTETPVDTMRVRATEYTVGPNGGRAMPAALPPESAYTYAVELSVDEAIDLGAVSVEFSKPVTMYLENFLDYNVGEDVPAGYYDRELGTWLPDNSGRIVAIRAFEDNRSVLRVTSDDRNATAQELAELNVTDEELKKLAQIYGQRTPPIGLWRVPLLHFSSWDCNWNAGPEGPGTAPPPPPPPPPPPCGRGIAGHSIIVCETQTLSEEIPITGTPFKLVYRSDQQIGRRDGHRRTLSLYDAGRPGTVQAVSARASIAGRDYSASFAPGVTGDFAVDWDGLDAYGRRVYGAQTMTLAIGYTYQAIAGRTVTFGARGNGWINVGGNAARTQITMWREWTETTRSWDARAFGLGGWSITPHHIYDVRERVLHYGDGRERRAESLGKVPIRVAGNGVGGYSGDGGPALQAETYSAVSVSVGPDGSIYFAGRGGHVRKVDANGTISTFAGSVNVDCDPSVDPEGPLGPCGDGGPASQASVDKRAYKYDDSIFGTWLHVHAAPDNSVYIVEGHLGRIRKVDASGKISTIAGTGQKGYNGDGIAATGAQLNLPWGVTTGRDGCVYIADTYNHRVRRVDPNGQISTVAGTGEPGNMGDGAAATGAKLRYPTAIAFDRAANLYIADYGNSAIRRVDLRGVIATVAGKGVGPADKEPLSWDALYPPSGDGQHELNATLADLMDLAAAPDGTLYLVSFFDHRLRAIGPDGIISTVAKTADVVWQPGDPSGPSPMAVAVGPEGQVCYSQLNSQTDRGIFCIKPALPGISLASTLIPSEDLSETYVFAGNGRHMKTLDGRSGSIRHEFVYDGTGRLAQIRDRDNLTTMIVRDGGGDPMELVAPFGQVTTLDTDENGFLSEVTNPEGETHVLDSDAAGLLLSVTKPSGATSTFGYDTVGLLQTDTSGGHSIELNSSSIGSTSSVTLTLASGLETEYAKQHLSTGGYRFTITEPTGLASTATIDRIGTTTIDLPDGFKVTRQWVADPRFGMMARALTETLVTPAGKTRSTATARSVAPSALVDPFAFTTVTETATTNGAVTTTTYTAATRTQLRTSPASRAQTTVFDEKARRVRIQMPGLLAETRVYDATGLLRKRIWGQDPNPQTDPDARIIEYTFEADGDLDTVTQNGDITSFNYDAASRVTSVVRPNGDTLAFSYTPDGDVETTTPPGRSAHTFSYAAQGKLKTYTPPALGGAADTVTWNYDVDGKIDNVVRADGGVIDYVYQVGRLASRSLPGGAGAINYGYDNAGRIRGLTAPNALDTNYTYDGPLIKTRTWTGAVNGSVAYDYDNLLRISAITVGGGSQITRQYDGDDLLTHAGSLTLTRDSATGLVTASTLSRVTDLVRFNDFGEAADDGGTAYVAKFDSTELWNVSIARDKLGRVEQWNETIGGTTRNSTYVYDNVGRLNTVNVTGSAVATYSYDYDANGNRDTVNNVLVAHFDGRDRLMDYSGASAVHQADGELTQLGSSTFTYDPLGNLVSAGTVTYVLDGEGRRVGKKVNGAWTQKFLYDGDRIIAELNGGDQIVSQFVYGKWDHAPDYMIREGRTLRILSDHLGSPRLVVDADSGVVRQRLRYDPYGVVLEDTVFANDTSTVCGPICGPDDPTFQPFGFAGGLYDRHTQLTHFGAREYDAQRGRWMSRDPLLFKGHDTNLYAYVGNDPINNIDPTGQFVGAIVYTGFMWMKNLGGQQVENSLLGPGGCAWRDDCGSPPLPPPDCPRDLGLPLAPFTFTESLLNNMTKAAAAGGMP